MTLHLAHPAAVERLRAGQPVLVVVPVVECPVCGDSDDPGEVIWPATGCLTRCDTCNGTALVPDPSYVAASKPTCETCGGKGKLGRYPIFNGPDDLTDCPACDGSCEPPLVTVTVPLLEVVEGDWGEWPKVEDWPDHDCILVDPTNPDEPPILYTVGDGMTEDVSDQLLWLAHDGDVAALVGTWVARVALGSPERPYSGPQGAKMGSGGTPVPPGPEIGAVA